MTAPQPASSFLLTPLAHCPGTNRLLWLDFLRQEAASLFGRGPLRGRCVGDLDPLKQSKLQLTLLPFATLIDQATKSKWQGGPFWVGQNEEKGPDQSAKI